MALWLTVWASVWMSGSAAAAMVCAPDRLMIGAPDLRATFAVEVADDAAERAQGLMYRSTMPSASGMLFVYQAPQHAVFWMKNTLLPLDMIFADATGRITRIHPDAVPLDETPIDGGEGVQFVLEINAGLSAALGLSPGMALAHPAIAQGAAALPCSEN